MLNRGINTDNGDLQGFDGMLMVVNSRKKNAINQLLEMVTYHIYLWRWLGDGLWHCFIHIDSA